MGTRSFVGFCQNDELKGWFNAYDGDYFGMGEKVLERYKQYDAKTLQLFFGERMLIGDLELIRDNNEDRVYIEDWMDEIFNIDWNTAYVSIIGNFDFFQGSTNTCSYVYNLDNDTVEIYHWHSKEPGFIVNRQNVDVALDMCNNWEQKYHWEKEGGNPYDFAEKEILGEHYIPVSKNHFKQNTNIFKNYEKEYRGLEVGQEIEIEGITYKICELDDIRDKVIVVSNQGEIQYAPMEKCMQFVKNKK